MSEDHSDGSTGTPEWRVPADEQLEADAYHVWKPRPLLRSIQWKPVPEPEKDAATGSYDVFLDQRVFRAMHQHLWNASSAEEPFGFLIGDLCEDPDSGRRYVIVSAAIPSKFQLQEDAPESMPRESLVALELEADRRKGVLAGWYRRRRRGPVELTASDMKMHEMHFPEPWQVAFVFVTDSRDPSGGCFRRALRGLQGDAPLPFHEMVSNESLLARGVRRSRVDWINVETSDSVEPDPPPRPEPEPEPVAEPEPIAEPESEPEPVAEPESSERRDEEGEEERDGVDDVALAVAADSDAGDGEEVEAPGDTPDEEMGDSGEEAFDIPLLDDEELGLVHPDVSVPEDPDARDADEPIDIPERSGLDLPILDLDVETADGKEAAGEPESLPEPAWDEEDLPGPVGTPSLEDVDLESFVVEVEGADVAGQVGDAPDPEEVEPGWDEPELEKTAEPEDEIVLPIAAEAEQTDAAVALEEIAAPGDPEEEVGRSEPDEGFEEAPAVTVPGSTPDRKPAVWRRPWILTAVLVGVAVVASLLLLGRSSGSGPETGGPAAAAPGAGSGGQDVPTTPESPGGAEGAGQVPSVVVDSAPPPATGADMERLGDALLESISRYYGRAVARDEGEATCEDLQTAYVEVEDRWITYNVQGRARFRGRLPESLKVRDERLYSGVQDVEREFNRSGCERP